MREQDSSVLQYNGTLCLAKNVFWFLSSCYEWISTNKKRDKAAFAPWSRSWVRNGAWLHSKLCHLVLLSAYFVILAVITFLISNPLLIVTFWNSYIKFHCCPVDKLKYISSLCSNSRQISSFSSASNSSWVSISEYTYTYNHNHEKTKCKKPLHWANTSPESSWHCSCSY